MKRVILLSVCTILMQTMVWADNDKPITREQLPVAAQQFIEKYFAGSDVSYVKEETECMGMSKSYEIIFTNGSKVEFDKDGDWTDVDCEFTRVPEGIVPPMIQSYVNQHYKESYVVEIDRDRRDYEVKLNNGLELKFDLKYNLIGIDD